MAEGGEEGFINTYDRDVEDFLEMWEDSPIGDWWDGDRVRDAFRSLANEGVLHVDRRPFVTECGIAPARPLERDRERDGAAAWNETKGLGSPGETGLPSDGARNSRSADYWSAL